MREIRSAYIGLTIFAKDLETHYLWTWASAMTIWIKTPEYVIKGNRDKSVTRELDFEHVNGEFDAALKWTDQASKKDRRIIHDQQVYSTGFALYETQHR